MTTQLTTTKRICEHLEKYVFDRVWNEPYTQYRTYVRPELLSKHTVVDTNGSPVIFGAGANGSEDPGEVVYQPYFAAGFFQCRYGSILLPPYVSDAELLEWLPKQGMRFAVYSVPSWMFGSSKLNIREWTLFSAYCSKNHMDLQLFTTDGICLNRGYIYIKQSDQNDSMLLAVESTMYAKLLGDIAQNLTETDPTAYPFPHVHKLLFGKYFDSDEVADNMIGVGKLTNRQIPRARSITSIGAITLPTRHGDDKVLVSDAAYLVRNGFLCVNDYAGTIAANDYLEAVVDKDITGFFDVELATGPKYIDEETESEGLVGTGSVRLLIHIPKKLNPDYNLITPDTCGVWAFSSDHKATSGIHLYCCGREEYFHQITHNDFSIDVSLLKQVAEEHGWCTYDEFNHIVSWNIVVRVYVRTHHKTAFIRDAHYIDFLYNLDDDGIIEMLLGQHSWQTDQSNPRLLFWKADRLEDSKYADALLRRRSRELDVRAVDPDDTSESWDGVPQWCKHDIYNKDPDYHPKAQCSVCGVGDLCPYKVEEDPIRDYVCPYYTSRRIQDYIEILGYFHVLALIGKRIFHFKKIVDDSTQYVVVTVPLALSSPELKPEDYYPLVYLNGQRVDQTDVSWNETVATNVSVKELTHSDTSDLEVASVVASNYSTRLKITINKGYKLTEGLAFNNYTKYYKKVGNEFIRALVVEAQPVEIARQELDADEETFIRVGLPFQEGVTYYTRVNGVYRKLVPTTNLVYGDYRVGESMDDFVSNNGGHPLFTGLDDLDLFSGNVPGMVTEGKIPGTGNIPAGRGPLDPNELALLDGIVGDIIPNDVEIYELHNEFNQWDTLSVELLDNRSAGSFEYIDLNEHQSDLAVKHQFDTLDSWSIYKITSGTDIDGSSRNVYTPVDPASVGTFDVNTKVFTFLSEIVQSQGGKYLFLEGPNVREDSLSFNVTGGSMLADTHVPGTTGIIGPGMWTNTSDKPKFNTTLPLDSEIVFMNNQRLIPNLDYVVTKPVDRTGSAPNYVYKHHGETVYAQCVSYLQEQNKLNVVRTNTTIIPTSTQRGFVIGKHISWKGQTPIWFDELSTLTVDGKLVAEYKQILGEMTLSRVRCRNGSTYEVKTSVSTRIMEIMNYNEAMQEDLNRISQIHEFFIESFTLPDMTAIIPHSHRLYSIFLEAIVHRYLTVSNYKIARLSEFRSAEDYKDQFVSSYYYTITEHDTVRSGTSYYKYNESTNKYVSASGLTVGTEIATLGYVLYQRTSVSSSIRNYFKALYDLDVVFKFKDDERGEAIAEDENPIHFLNFIDVYGIYHPLVVKYREDYDKLQELCDVFLPADPIKHKEAKR